MTFAGSSLCVAIIASLSLSAHATSGYVHGDQHCYHFEAPVGWVLDTKSGTHAHLPMVLYPQGATWENAPVRIHTRAVTYQPRASAAAGEPYRDAAESLAATSPARTTDRPSAQFVRRIRGRSGAEGSLWALSGARAAPARWLAILPARETLTVFGLEVREGDPVAAIEALQQLTQSYHEDQGCPDTAG